MNETTRVHPSAALFDAGDLPTPLPVCDHYCGVEARMRKSLALQAELGPVFDVTLDCEDGAPIGGEAEHAQMAAELAMSAANVHGRPPSAAALRAGADGQREFEAHIKRSARSGGAYQMTKVIMRLQWCHLIGALNVAHRASTWPH